VPGTRAATPREAAGHIWTEALAAGNVDPLVREALLVEGHHLTAGSLSVDLDAVNRIVVLGCGKASGAMAAAVEAVLGDRVGLGLVVVKDGYRAPTRRIRTIEAGHPVPDGRGQAASAELLALAENARADDLVLVLISGGGSALTPAPAPPVTLAEKQEVTRLLLAAGATINELNAVRKHLSLFKGGQLARAAAPARVMTLILSDVIGDPLDVIASGPTAPDPSTFEDALGVLARRGILDRVGSAIVTRLHAGIRGEIPETPKPNDSLFSRVGHVVIGNNARIVTAAAVSAERLGYPAEVITRELQGEAREVARRLIAQARRRSGPLCLIAGGETTVTVQGPGEGGRCQEFALGAAIELAGDENIDNMVVLAAGTDGTDGPTDAAGGIVDSATVARGREQGLDARAALDANDAHRFLAATGDLVITGPTNTNLLDLYLVVQT
jgi:glycerate 2-kinase